MSTEKKKHSGARWLYPLLLALPFLAVIAFVLIRYWPLILDVINVMIKAVVVS